MTETRLQISGSWPTPVSLPAWNELWRTFSDQIPIPIVLDVPIESGVVPIAEWEDEQQELRAQLVAGGYAVWEGVRIRPTRPARDMLRVLARPQREVDIRMEIRGEPVRVLAAAPIRGDVVRVSLHGSVVSIEKVATGAAELAAVDRLPSSPGMGRIRALTIPVADLERAIESYRSAQFIDTLTKNIGRAAADVHDLLRRESTLRAKFGIAARDRNGRRTRDPFAVVVHDSPAGRHVFIRQNAHITIDRADDRRITAILEQRLNAVAEHG